MDKKKIPSLGHSNVTQLPRPRLKFLRGNNGNAQIDREKELQFPMCRAKLSSREAFRHACYVDLGTITVSQSDFMATEYYPTNDAAFRALLLGWSNAGADVDPTPWKKLGK